MKYSQLVPAPKILVRRATVDAMVEHGALIDTLIADGKLKAINPGGKVELFRVKEVEAAVEAFVREGAAI